jgi:hypothetical protein
MQLVDQAVAEQVAPERAAAEDEDASTSSVRCPALATITGFVVS